MAGEYNMSLAHQIPKFFETYGWAFEQQRPDLFRTGFLGDEGSHEIWVRLADPWIYFSINPFVPRADGQPHSDKVLALLLEANFDLNLAKFAIDQDGDVALSAELPLEGFAYSHFADALTALSHYADTLRPRFVELLDAPAGEVV